tara:strand:+ start:5725 stop:6507 length:783 start_codon:yes stop_codon:yes gene_type:complete
MLTKQLEKFGLSEKEAKVYVALIELEVATANEVAERADVNRSSTYVVLDSLLNKGLVSISEDKTVKQYVATNPEILIQEIEATIQERTAVKEGLHGILPELKALHKDTKRKPKVKVFEGKKGLIAAFEDSLTTKNKVIRIASSVTKISKILPLYMPKYIDRRSELGIRMIGIHPDHKLGRFLMGLKSSKTVNDDAILIPEDTFEFTSDFAIYDNKVAYMNEKNGGTAVIIEDKEIAEMSKNVFDLAHKEAKRIQDAAKKS